MSNEHAQPLREQPPRNPADQELVGKVLGREAAADMEELTGDQAKTPTKKPDDLEMNNDEQTTTNQIEQTVSPENRRKQLIEWVNSHININTFLSKEYTAETWVDEFFTVNPDGTVDAPRTIDLISNTVDYLPEGLNEIDGDFIMSSASLKSLDNLPKKINGDLDITCLPFCKSIPSGIIVTGNIYIDNNQTDLLADAQAKGYNVAIVQTITAE